MENRLERLGLSLDSIAIFRGVMSDGVITRMRRLIAVLGSKDTGMKLRQYSSFVEALYRQTVNFSEYVLKTVFEDDNTFIALTAQGKEIDTNILEAAENELRILQELSQLTSDEMTEELGYEGALPQWRTCRIDFLAEYKWRRENIGHCGYGKYSRRTLFALRGGVTVPVKCPEIPSLTELSAGGMQAAADNALDLLGGKGAQNVLLTGNDKDITLAVRAAVSEFADRGLRLIEVQAEDMGLIPALADELCADPLKFIIFIDDIPSSVLRARPAALRAALRSTALLKNAVIYAGCTDADAAAAGAEWQGIVADVGAK